MNNQQFIITYEQKHMLISLFIDTLSRVNQLDTQLRFLLQNDTNQLRIYESEDLPKVRSILHRLESVNGMLAQLPSMESVSTQEDIFQEGISQGKLYVALELLYRTIFQEPITVENPQQYKLAMQRISASYQ